MVAIKLKYAEKKIYFFSLENRFAECNFQKHSANNNGMLRKKLFFSLENRFVECNSQKHSANNNPLPSVFWKNTRQIIFFAECEI